MSGKLQPDPSVRLSDPAPPSTEPTGTPARVGGLGTAFRGWWAEARGRRLCPDTDRGETAGGFHAHAGDAMSDA
jgi:hypothetical protein